MINKFIERERERERERGGRWPSWSRETVGGGGGKGRLVLFIGTAWYLFVFNVDNCVGIK